MPCSPESTQYGGFGGGGAGCYGGGGGGGFIGGIGGTSETTSGQGKHLNLKISMIFHFYLLIHFLKNLYIYI